MSQQTFAALLPIDDPKDLKRFAEDVQVCLGNTIQGRIVTTDATATTLAQVKLAASATYLIEARVVARRTGGAAGTADDGAAYVIRAAYQTAAGTVTLIGAVSQIFVAENQAAWNCTFDVSNPLVRVRVTGAANNNVSWAARVTVDQVGT